MQSKPSLPLRLKAYHHCVVISQQALEVGRGQGNGDGRDAVICRCRPAWRGKVADGLRLLRCGAGDDR